MTRKDLYIMNRLVDLYYCFQKPNYKILSDEEMDRQFGERISNKIPTMIGRMGASETSVIRIVEFDYRRKYTQICDQLCRWSGFFPKKEDLLERFSKIYKESLKAVDFIHPMSVRGENFFFKKYCKKDVQFISNPGPWAMKNPWTKHLKGKSVLVIHPFEKSIQNQYMIREKIFSNPDMLPEFELKTLKAVQTIAWEKDDRFTTWFEALDWMKHEMKRYDYDIALIGCGAYGFPLAAYAKQQGKIAIHMGGDLQILFGIWGSRWNTNEEALRVRNEYWTVPLPEETPQAKSIVENGCYW